MPDSPPETIKRDWQNRGGYHGQGTSRLMAGGDHEGEGAGNMNEDDPPPAETAEQRAARLEGQMALARDENLRLQHELEAERRRAPPNCGRPQ